MLNLMKAVEQKNPGQVSTAWWSDGAQQLVNTQITGSDFILANYHFQYLYSLLLAFLMKKLHIICVFQNKHFQQILSVLIFKKLKGESQNFLKISFLWNKNMMGRRACPESSCKAVDKTGQCVLSLHLADPGLCWSSYFMILRRTVKIFCTQSWVVSTF